MLAVVARVAQGFQVAVLLATQRIIVLVVDLLCPGVATFATPVDARQLLMSLVLPPGCSQIFIIPASSELFSQGQNPLQWLPFLPAVLLLLVSRHVDTVRRCSRSAALFPFQRKRFSVHSFISGRAGGRAVVSGRGYRHQSQFNSLRIASAASSTSSPGLGASSSRASARRATGASPVSSAGWAPVLTPSAPFGADGVSSP